MKNGLESNFVVKYTVDQVAQNNLILMCSYTLKCPLVKAQNIRALSTYWVRCNGMSDCLPFSSPLPKSGPSSHWKSYIIIKFWSPHLLFLIFWLDLSTQSSLVTNNSSHDNDPARNWTPTGWQEQLWPDDRNDDQKRITMMIKRG